MIMMQQPRPGNCPRVLAPCLEAAVPVSDVETIFRGSFHSIREYTLEVQTSAFMLKITIITLSLKGLHRLSDFMVSKIIKTAVQ